MVKLVRVHGSVDLEKQIGQRIRALREERELSQAQLGQLLAAHGLPMGQPTIYKMENGMRPLRVNELHTLAAALDVPMDTLLTGARSSEADAAEKAYRRAWVNHRSQALDHARARDRWMTAEREMKAASEAAEMAHIALQQARVALEAAHGPAAADEFRGGMEDNMVAIVRALDKLVPAPELDEDGEARVEHPETS